MDKSWIKEPRTSQAYKKGVKIFIEFVRHGLKGNDKNPDIRCPCNKCCNEKWFKLDVIEEHIMFNGFLSGYTRWVCHGERESSSKYDTPYMKKMLSKSTSAQTTSVQPSVTSEEDIQSLLQDALGLNYSNLERGPPNAMGDEGERNAEIAKEARASQIHTHTTGAMSYARARHKFEVKNKRKAGPVEFFDLTHKTKRGTYIQEDSRQFMEKAKEHLLEFDGTSESSEATSNFQKEAEVWVKLMGEDKPGRARGYGIGVTKTQVTGHLADLRAMRNKGLSSNTSNSTTQVNMPACRCTQMEQQIESLQSMMQQILPFFLQMFGRMPMNAPVNAPMDPSVNSSIDPIQLFLSFCQMNGGMPTNQTMNPPLDSTRREVFGDIFGRQIPDVSSGNDNSLSPGDDPHTLREHES